MNKILVCFIVLSFCGYLQTSALLHAAGEEKKLKPAGSYGGNDGWGARDFGPSTSDPGNEDATSVWSKRDLSPAGSNPAGQSANSVWTGRDLAAPGEGGVLQSNSQKTEESK